MAGVLYLCINLKHAHERREAMVREAKRIGVCIRVLEAIDGRNLDLATAPFYDRSGRLANAPDLQPNEVACVLSHRLALETFLVSDAQAAVVLEDDAVLSDALPGLVEAVLALPFAWDAINLENRNGKPIWPAIARIGNNGLYASAWLSKGAAGWLYSRHGAVKTLRSLDGFRHPYDTHIGFFWRHGRGNSRPPSVQAAPFSWASFPMVNGSALGASASRTKSESRFGLTLRSCAYS